MAQVTEEEISAEIQETVMRAYLRYSFLNTRGQAAGSGQKSTWSEAGWGHSRISVTNLLVKERKISQIISN